MSKGNKTAKTAIQEKVEQAVEEAKEVFVTTKELSAELGVPGTYLRKVLRDKFYDDGVFTRYQWSLGDPILLEIREAVNESVQSTTERKTASAQSKEEKVESRKAKKSSERAAKVKKTKNEADDTVLEDDDVEELEELEDDDDGVAGEDAEATDEDEDE